MSFAQGQCNAVLMRILNRLTRLDSLAEMGFETEEDRNDFEPSAPKSASSSSQERIPTGFLKARLRTENSYAETAWTYALSFFKYRALKHTHYTHSFPNLFILLLSESGGVQKKGLMLCKQAWLAIEALERKARANSRARKLFNSMYFPLAHGKLARLGSSVLVSIVTSPMLPRLRLAFSQLASIGTSLGVAAG